MQGQGQGEEFKTLNTLPGAVRLATGLAVDLLPPAIDDGIRLVVPAVAAAGCLVGADWGNGVAIA